MGSCVGARLQAGGAVHPQFQRTALLGTAFCSGRPRRTRSAVWGTRSSSGNGPVLLGVVTTRISERRPFQNPPVPTGLWVVSSAGPVQGFSPNTGDASSQRDWSPGRGSPGGCQVGTGWDGEPGPPKLVCALAQPHLRAACLGRPLRPRLGRRVSQRETVRSGHISEGTCLPAWGHDRHLLWVFITRRMEKEAA